MIRPLCTALAIAASTPLGAQDFNLDVQPAGSAFGLPAPSYGGAAGRPGVWMPISGETTSGLVAIDGQPTSVELRFTALGGYFEEQDVPGTSGGDQALLDDSLRSISVAWRFENLEPGHYRLYSASVAVLSLQTWMYVAVEEALAERYVLLFAHWAGEYHHGLSYTVHDVLVTDGVLEVHQYPEPSLHDEAATCALQLVRVSEPGAPYCVCSGSSPCDNAQPHLAGCRNSTGAGAALRASGSASVASDDLRFFASDLPPHRSALLFSGNDEQSAPFGDGRLCVQGDLRRLALTTSTAGGAAFLGPGLGAGGGWSAGETRRFQLWYRDPAGPCGSGWNLSNGYLVPFVP